VKGKEATAPWGCDLTTLHTHTQTHTQDKWNKEKGVFRSLWDKWDKDKGSVHLNHSTCPKWDYKAVELSESSPFLIICLPPPFPFLLRLGSQPEIQEFSIS